MKNKLQTFTRFAQSLLPHETAYLCSIQQFQDAEKVGILQKIHANCANHQHFEPFDEGIDKRKYAALKTWIEEQLAKISVDAQYEWIMHLQQRIMTDAIAPEEEKTLLRALRDYPAQKTFYFVKFFELVQDYRQYLLIRMRYEEHRQTDIFYKTYRTQYEYCRAVNDKMHDATLDIVQQYAKGEAESMVWEEWLTERFYDEQLDGLSRYNALVRLTFIYNNYRRFDKLLSKYNYIDTLFNQGVFYSKRLLVNYYGNRLLLHTRFNELDKAEYYGFMSIRAKNSDYLHYVNNLCSVLLRSGKNEAALRLMRAAHPELKQTQSFHNRVGFMAFYAKALNVNNLHRNAENYVEAFLRVFQKEIFEHRWHLFFTTYIESLLGQRKYDKLLQVVHRLRLLDREKQYCRKGGYLPSIGLYHALAAFKTDKTTFQTLKTTIADIRQQPDRKQHAESILHNLATHLTERERAEAIGIRGHREG